MRNLLLKRLYKVLLISLLGSLLLLSGCASKPTVDPTTGEVHDPLEGFNRTMFSFNAGLDHYIVKPIAKGYRWVTPNFIESGISRFFSNLGELPNALNALLQGKLGDAANYTGRFVVNSTIGVGGLLEVADSMGLDKGEGEDFGQTLGTWGLSSGPYLVLPILGPSTVRDGLGFAVDRTYMDSFELIDHEDTRDTLRLVDMIDTRAQLLSLEGLIQGDEYIFVRDAYLQRRDYLLNDGVVEDSFEVDDDEDF